MADNIEDLEDDRQEAKETARRLRIQTQCGGCRFLHKYSAKGNDSPCIHLGYNENSMACEMFDPDYQLSANTVGEVGEIFKTFGSLFDGLREAVPNKRIAHLIGLIAYALANSERLENTTRKKRGEALTIGQRVFAFIELPHTKKEFANLWYEAYVIGLSKQGHKTNEEFLTVYSSVTDLTGHSPNADRQWAILSMPVDSKSLITEEQMQDKLVGLMQRGALNYEAEDFPQVEITEDEAGECDVRTVQLAEAPDSILHAAREKFRKKLKLEEEERSEPPVRRRNRSLGNFGRK